MPSEIHHQICQVYGDNAMSDGMVRKWVQVFSEGRENMPDEAQSGRPSLVNDDLVRKVNERVCDDRCFTISDLSLHFPQISRTLLYDIVSSHFGLLESVCTMGAQDAHRGALKTACCMCFDISYALSQGRRRHVVTGDETLVSHITPESKQQSFTGSILARQKEKSSSRHFQQGRSCAPYSGTDKVFSWKNFCPKAQQ